MYLCFLRDKEMANGETNSFTKVLTEILCEARKFQSHLPKGTTNREYKSRVPCATLNFSSVHMNVSQCNCLFEKLTDLHLSYKINPCKKVKTTI